MNGVFLEVGQSLHLGFLNPKVNKRIGSAYGNCVIPFYKCTLSVLGLCLPFTSFETKLLKHPMMAPLQLHLVS